METPRDSPDRLALAAMGRDCVPMCELSIVGRDAPTIVEMNAVAVYAAHGGQLTIRCTEALILAIRKHEELVTRSHLYRLAFMDDERASLPNTHLRLTTAFVACSDEFSEADVTVSASCFSIPCDARWKTRTCPG